LVVVSCELQQAHRAKLAAGTREEREWERSSDIPAAASTAGAASPVGNKGHASVRVSVGHEVAIAMTALVDPFQSLGLVELL
jgi:hypothetical protein